MEMFTVHKIHCLVCDKIIETDDDVVSCQCDNHSTLDNRFTFSSPNSSISALDKTKLKGQLLNDINGLGKTGDWFLSENLKLSRLLDIRAGKDNLAATALVF